MEYNLTQPIAERKTKTVYRDGNKTIKLFIENYSKAAILNEALIQSRVEESTDLKISRLLEVTKIENRWALVTEFIEGTPLDVLMREHSEKQDEYLNLFVNIQLEIMSKKVSTLNRLKDKYRRKLEEADIDDTTRYELLQRLEGTKNHDKLCHGDFNPSNVIINANGEYSIIDWAHATQGNASADVAKTFLLFSLNGQTELAEKYLDLFTEKSGIERRGIQRWIPIVAAVQLKKGGAENREFLESTLTVGKESLKYNTQPEGETGNIKTVIPNIKDEYIDKVEIIKGFTINKYSR